MVNNNAKENDVKVERKVVEMPRRMMKRWREQWWKCRVDRKWELRKTNPEMARERASYISNLMIVSKFGAKEKGDHRRDEI